MPHTDYDCNLGCPIEATLEVIGGKWKSIILYHLMEETLRFNELRRVMPEITHRMLTKQLRELEQSQLVARKVFPEVPPKVEYSLTSYGQTLHPVLSALQIWGIEHLKTSSE
ncbi:hypothetical protein PCIT_a0242 [Pseudoalteromonas citrea]|uniref:HTH hxlR-type domain-containing protein n=2 Tax=Pseudoalteromonas citrea TaxID=43655 RepID=A0AAD4AKG1_9GAMM|nr:helix-turn-helix domain-containing protein [Pseudoalteromonas citrea]KAF7773899.1 hypothetical protein PCIT_a0242 [Pseudoalteromonas citrea]